MDALAARVVVSSFSLGPLDALPESRAPQERRELRRGELVGVPGHGHQAPPRGDALLAVDGLDARLAHGRRQGDERLDVDGRSVAVGRDAEPVRGLAALPLAAVVVVVVRRRFG